MTYRIMIACVTVEVAMVVSPALRYRPKEIHIFRYIRDSGSGRAKLYTDHYAEVVDELSHSLPDCTVIEHTDEPVYDFGRMSRSLDMVYNQTVREHPDCEILANLSSGPREFSATLGIFSYLHPRVTLFKVPTEEYAVGEEELQRYFYDNGRAVGLSRRMYPPKEIAGIRLEPPDERRVRALRMYQSLIDCGTEPYWNRMVPLLKVHGLWDYEPSDREYGSDLELREKLNYFRHYRAYWKEMGWIGDEKRRCPRLTPSGKAVIEMFYVDSEQHPL